MDLRTRQAFGDGTTDLLRSLSVGVAGCSGTGSWVIELLGRLGIGRLVLVDPDTIECKNMNRIVNSPCGVMELGLICLRLQSL